MKPDPTPRPIYLTADRWQALTMALHAGAHVLRRIDQAEMWDDEAFGVEVIRTAAEALADWEHHLDDLRPKTALADQLTDEP